MAPSAEETVRRLGVELAAIAQTGLTYGRDPFDAQRYGRLQEMAVALLELVSDSDLAALRRVAVADRGYATPKLDVRGAVFNEDGHVLLVRDRSDGLWTLPGGWCDVLESPSEAVEREVREETGVRVHAYHLVGLLDRERRGHEPPFAYHVYKLFFLCEEIARGEPDELETLAVHWFPLDGLPPLSGTRVTRDEIDLSYAHYLDPTLSSGFD